MSASVLIALLTLAPLVHAKVPWCRTEEIAPFSSALEYLDLPPGTDVIPETDVQEIITDAFLRASCDTQNLGAKDCSNVSTEAFLRTIYCNVCDLSGNMSTREQL